MPSTRSPCGMQGISPEVTFGKGVAEATSNNANTILTIRLIWSKAVSATPNFIMKIPKQIKGGLLPLKKDSRDFTLGGVFGERVIPPNHDFMVAEPLVIKDQYDSDMCTAFACCAVSEDQENVLLSPEWFFAQVKKMKGNYKSWGADLRSVCRTACEAGFLEKNYAKYDLIIRNRDFLADWENWPDNETDPLKHKKKSYFSVDIQGDIFDSFRSALWEYKEKKCTILTGCLWLKNWTNSPEGIIPDGEGTPIEGHAFKIFGQKNIRGKLYLVAQLSNGTDIGDNGIFYFSREVANRTFKGYGAFMFIDAPPEEVKDIVWGWKEKLYNFFIKLTKIFTR